MSGSAMAYDDAPPVRYMGSKWMLAKWIIDLFPPHEVYVEPYCGGASIFFRKGPAPIEILNDSYGDLVNFFDCLRTRTAELIRAIELTPYARAEYNRAFTPVDDPLERARRFYIRSRMAFAAETHVKSGWRTQKTNSRRSPLTQEWKRLHGLWKAADRLRDAQIECRDALAVIAKYDSPVTLFYVDPPYVKSSRARADNRYHHEMDDDDHRVLAAVLHNCKGAVVLSGYQSALYDDLYAGWLSVSKTTTTNGNGAVTEWLWLSPRADALRHPLFPLQIHKNGGGVILMIDEAHFLALAGRVMSDATPLPVEIQIRDAWFIVSALQLAIRHPYMSAQQQRWMIATARQFQQAIEAVHPEAAELLEMGWNRDFDVPPDDDAQKE